MNKTVEAIKSVRSDATAGPTDYDTILDRYFGTASESQSASITRRQRESMIKLAAVALSAALNAAEPRRLGSGVATQLIPVGTVAASQSASDEQATAWKLREQLGNILRNALWEDFRDGMPSQFAHDLRTLVLDFGTAAVTELQRFIAARPIRPGLGFEALTALATFNYPSIASDRRRLIEWALTSPSSEIRYGAALALVSLGDPMAVQPLEAAISSERIPDLRHALQKVLQAIKEK